MSSGVSKETWTLDSMIKSHVLYQLRHISILNKAVLQTPFNYDYQSITTGSTGKWNKTYTFVNSIKVDHKLYQDS